MCAGVMGDLLEPNSHSARGRAIKPALPPIEKTALKVSFPIGLRSGFIRLSASP